MDAASSSAGVSILVTLPSVTVINDWEATSAAIFVDGGDMASKGSTPTDSLLIDAGPTLPDRGDVDDDNIGCLPESLNRDIRRQYEYKYFTLNLSRGR